MIDKTDYQNTLKDAFLRHYEEGSDEWSHDESLSLATQKTIVLHQKLFINEPVKALDIGCGNGKRSKSISNLHSYLGIDIIQNKEWAQYKDSDLLTFITADVLEWFNNSNQTFNIILDNGCFHHQHPSVYENYLNEVHHKLEKNGLFSLVVWGEEFVKGNVDIYGRIHSHFTMEQLSNLLNKTKLNVVYAKELISSKGRKQLHFICKK